VNFEFMFRQIFPRLLASEGVNSSQFPIFFFYNTVMSASSPNDLKHCCTLGFHAAPRRVIQGRSSRSEAISESVVGDHGITTDRQAQRERGS
jgi:hypothetical protein